MSARNRRRLGRVSALGAAVALGLGGLLLAGAAPALADTGGSGGSGGIGISVDVPGSTDTPTPSPSVGDQGGHGDQGGQGDQGSQGGQGNQGNQGNQGDQGSQGGAANSGTGGSGGKTATAGDTPQNIGPLNLSGLHAQYRPSIDPGAGSVLVWYSIHNGSKSTISSTNRFWLTGPVGNTVSDSGTYAIPAIAPGKTVVVSLAMPKVGQWTVLTAHATYTPPKTVDGTALKPLTRDVTIFAFPWLNTGVALSVAGIAIAAAAKPALFGFLARVVTRT